MNQSGQTFVARYAGSLLDMGIRPMPRRRQRLLSFVKQSCSLRSSSGPRSASVRLGSSVSALEVATLSQRCHATLAGARR